jgi:RNA polymerase sigma-70 factor (ECF subfamily)
METATHMTEHPPRTRDARSDPDAGWNAALERERVGLLAWALHCAGGAIHAAEDLVQETMLTAYRRRDEFRSGSELGVWLRGILLRHSLNERRRRRPLPCAEAIVEGAFSQEPAVATDSPRLRALRACIEALQPRQRALVTMRYEEGLTPDAMAQRTGAKQSTLRAQLVRVRRRLLECVSRRLGPSKDGRTH